MVGHPRGGYATENSSFSVILSAAVLFAPADPSRCFSDDDLATRRPGRCGSTRVLPTVVLGG
jgi:hypothetical protein